MKRAQIFTNDGSQAVRLPREFSFDTDEVSIRRAGSAVVLEPIAKRRWPSGFFEKIRIDDPAFERPDQGEMPASPSFDDGEQ